ncbi:septation regulator SpoVG [Heliobacterium chlorum]|uniref:Putative septation protein SpoVG n=1 Tax=Heliobacterium chlorum TaxID=2698 RepID=A0ABR7T1I3_HELCL|nr:septation regulator SpoVG [Heliobacterium chlorum]MBC9783863.1 septation regulator SpoVG [Heliobacterium chlorum]
MNVTDVKIRKLNTTGPVKAIASVTIDNEFVIHEVKVVEGPNGIFVAMPSRRTADGKYRDIAHPVSPEARALVTSIVLETYERAKSSLLSSAGI